MLSLPQMAPPHNSDPRWSRLTAILCCVLLLGALCVLPISIVAEAALTEQAEIWVDDDYDAGTPGWNVTHFATLTQGLSVVAPGGTIHLYEGTYTGPFQIAKPGVHIEGMGAAANTVLHGNGGNYAVYITANNVTLTRLAVMGASVQGVRLASCAGDRIAECLIQGNGCAGVEIAAGQNHIIEANEIADNQSAGQALGVHVIQGASGVIVRQNVIRRHRDTLKQGAGVLIESGCSATQVLTNTLENNDFGVRITESTGSVIEGNTVTLSGLSGIHIQDAWASVVRDNQVSRNQGSGVMLVHQAPPESLTAELALVERNFCESNQAAGIYTRGGGHIRMQYNTCRANAMHGVAVESSYITLTANSLISNTLTGLRLYDLDPYTNQPITSVVAHGNTLAGNGARGLQSEMPGQVEATGNWWGVNTPTLGNEVVGNVAFQPYMTLSAQALPAAIAIGGEAAQVGAHIGGGGYKVLDGTAVRLQTSAGALESTGPLWTVGGQANTRLFSGSIAQWAVVTVTVDSAVVTTSVEFYDPTSQSADWALSFDGGPDPVCAGYNLAYSLTCQNTGSVKLHHVRITDTLPQGVWPMLDQSSPGAVYDAASRTVSWDLGVLDVEARTSLDLRLHTATSLNAGDVLVSVLVATADELAATQVQDAITVIACATPTPSFTPTPMPSATPKPSYTPAPTLTPTSTSVAPDTGALVGVVWVDVNRNAQRDADEPVWVGAQIELRKAQAEADTEPLATTWTGADGRYAFLSLAEGEYCLRLSPLTRYRPATSEWCGVLSAGATGAVDWPLIEGQVVALPFLCK